MTEVLLGNTAPVNSEGVPAVDANGKPVGNTITTFGMREGWDNEEESQLAMSTDNDPVLNQIRDYLTEAPDRVKIGVLEVQDAWQYHATPGDLPEWVESDDDELAQAISEWFSIRGHDCAVGRPGGWNDSMSAAVLASLYPQISGGACAWDEFEQLDPLAWREHNLLVNAGRDALHAQHLSTSAPPATFNYMCLSANATAASAASTTLPWRDHHGGRRTAAGAGHVRAHGGHQHLDAREDVHLQRLGLAAGDDRQDRRAQRGFGRDAWLRDAVGHVSNTVTIRRQRGNHAHHHSRLSPNLRR